MTDQAKAIELLRECVDALEPGTTTGPSQMATFEGRVAWAESTRELRNRTRALLAQHDAIPPHVCMSADLNHYTCVTCGKNLRSPDAAPQSSTAEIRTASSQKDVGQGEIASAAPDDEGDPDVIGTDFEPPPSAAPDQGMPEEPASYIFPEPDTLIVGRRDAFVRKSAHDRLRAYALSLREKREGWIPVEQGVPTKVDADKYDRVWAVALDATDRPYVCEASWRHVARGRPVYSHWMRPWAAAPKEKATAGSRAPLSPGAAPE